MEHKEQIRVIEGLLKHIDEGTNVDAGQQMLVPTDTYTCSDRASSEWQKLFENYPQVMGLSAELPEANSFFTSDELGKPILCTRDRHGQFHAFINACRHRGTVVETERRGKRNVFTCPFHAWSYSPQGDLVAVPKENHFGDIAKTCYSLVELPAVEEHGMLWIHPQPEGEINLDELLGETLRAELDSWQLANMHFDSDDVYDHAMNWKLAIDTFGETYHFSTLHKNTLASTFYGNVQLYDTYKRNHRMSLCMKEIDSLREVPTENWDVLVGSLPTYYIFPNVQLLMGRAGPTLVRVFPRGEDANDSFSKIHFYVRPEIAEITDENIRRQIGERMQGFGSVIRDEDYVAAASSHQGLASGAMENVVFGRNEPALQHYHRTYREALGLAPLEN